jgi:signal transduction histidine kinase
VAHLDCSGRDGVVKKAYVNMANVNDNHEHQFLSGGGVCGELARSVDWAKTPLGPPESWPACLKTMVGVILHSRHPMFLWWGKDLIQIYNDAYIPSFGVGKHPAAMGQRGEDCWQEIWPIIKPQIDAVIERGEPSWNVDHLVPILRNGHLEEVYWTYGYSPVYTESGAIGGALVVCTETSQRILAVRRLGIIRALAVELLRAQHASTMFDALMSTLANAERDVPFATIYGATGQPARVGLDEHAAAVLDHAVRDDLDKTGRHALATPIAAGPWPEPVSEVLVLGLDGGPGRGVVFGLSPRLPFDAAYQGFLEQLVENVLAAQARARIDEERRNLLEKAPVAAALLTGPDHVFEIANARYCEMVGRDVLGKAYLEAFPELRDTPVAAIMDGVYERKERFETRELLVPLRQPDGTVEERYFTFNLEPVTNSEGHMSAMMVVAVEVTELVTARLELERTGEERQRLLAAADVAARAKDEFLAMLGHELRNPLAPIVTAVNLIKVKGGEPIRREREIIERQAKHLVRLVDDLLEASRLAQGKVELKRTRVALNEIVSAAVEIAAPLLETKGHQLRIDVPTGLFLHGDAMRLGQVVANLLTNAARYTPPSGKIAVIATRRDDVVALRVKDNGVGIPADQLSSLFNMFFQGPRRNDRSEGGLGLGLALVKSLVELHGGSVTARSEGTGRGSTFEVTLPLAGQSAGERGGASRAPALERQRRKQSSRVLLVDDNRDLTNVLASFLEEAGCAVWVAHDGVSALALARQVRPSVAVVDIGLPVMDGYELAARVRHELGSDAPRLIAMTGYGQPEDRARSARAGFERHLVKPVDGSELLVALDEAS